MYGKAQFEAHQAEAGWRWWCDPRHSPLRPKQRSVPNPKRESRKAPLRRCHAIQHPQQRRIAGLLALYERKKGLDLKRCPEQGQKGAYRSCLDGRDREGAASKQSELVWLDLVCLGRHSGAGNRNQLLAERGVFAMAAGGIAEIRAYPSTCSHKGSLLRPATFQAKHCLSVHRISSTSHISVYRIRRASYLSVHRIYEGQFLPSALSVHRTPTSNTTPISERDEIRKGQA
jgi:hypothetical protein